MENIFLEVRNINKSFGKFQALKDVNMTIEKGSIYGLVGPNGAGKSTIIRHITGVYKPDWRKASCMKIRTASAGSGTYRMTCSILHSPIFWT